MILTDKDAKTLENNNKFKSVELDENFVNVPKAQSHIEQNLSSIINNSATLVAENDPTSNSQVAISI